MPAGALETLRERYAAELEPAPLPEEPSEPAAEPDPQEPEIPAEAARYFLLWKYRTNDTAKAAPALSKGIAQADHRLPVNGLYYR